MRAIKRERYGKKELDRLKKTLGILDNSVKTDVEILEENNVITFTTASELRKDRENEKKKELEDQTSVDASEILIEDVEMNNDLQKARLQKGSFPAWMNHRQIRKITDIKAKAKRLRKKKKGHK